MRKANKTLRAMGSVAPVTLAFVLAAPVAMGHEATDENMWAAVDETAWVNRYEECWKSKTGPSGLAPCSVAEPPPEVTLRLNFEFDMFKVPDNVINLGEVAKIDEHIAHLRSTPEDEYVTVVGHTDAKGSDDYNWTLGLKRADAVRDYIIAQGYPAEQVAPAESRGKSELLPGVDPFSQEQRRVMLGKTKL